MIDPGRPTYVSSSNRSPRLSAPVFPDVGVLGLVPDGWGGPWQTRHHVLTRLSTFFRVVWVSPAPYWRSVLRSDAEPQGVRLGNVDFPPYFTVYRPESWLPRFFRPAALARLTLRERLRRAHRALRRSAVGKTVLYLWRPEYDSALDLVPHHLSCYHIDDEYSFSPIEGALDEREAALVKRVDRVYIQSRPLMEKKGHLNPNASLAPNGVDYARYAIPWKEPADLASIPRPRVGYVGILKAQLDFELLLTLARRHRDWSFVFVGPSGALRGQVSSARDLSRMPNVHFLGGKPLADLPAYTQHLDVCMLCYRVDGYTKFIYPIKLHEYLASGRPVIGSPIDTVLDFSDVVTVARTPDEWSRAITGALGPDACRSDLVAARRRVARNHDWDGIVREIARSICDGLGPTYRDRFAQPSGSGGVR